MYNKKQVCQLCALVFFTMVIPVWAFSQDNTAIRQYFTAVRQSFNEQNAYNTVAYVEKRWRIAGNRGFDESIHYIEAILKKAGFVNETIANREQRLTYRIEKRPMQKPTWEPIDAKLEIVGETEPLLEFATNRNMIAINSAGTPAEGMDVEVVYADGISKEFLDKIDCKNKLLFAELGIGQVYRAARQRGALGALGYALPAYTQPLKHPNAIQFSGIQQTDSLNRGFGILLSTRAKNRLKEALVKGPVKLRVRIATKIYYAEELTIVADVRGVQRPDERFVFSAHVQEPGANDNASGVGTLAEMARVTAELIQQKKYHPERSISFLWGDEIVSTRRYVTQDTAMAKGILWGMSLDMVGEDTRKTGGTFLIEKMPDPSAVWTRGEEKHTEWGGRPLPESAIVPHYFNDFILSRCLDQAATNGWVVKTNPFEGGSDHTPFLEAKIPGLLMWHFTDVYYHTDGDRLENVSAREMKNVGVSGLVAAMALTTMDEPMVLFSIDELKKLALKRLSTEFALGKDNMQKEGNREKENHILEVWGKYYEGALSKMNTLRVGGTVPAIDKAIGLAIAEISNTTREYTSKM